MRSSFGRRPARALQGGSSTKSPAGEHKWHSVTGSAAQSMDLGGPLLEMFFHRGVMGFRPPKVMKNGSGSATTLSGSTGPPFVISTGA
jgi:hypothetical protein